MFFRISFSEAMKSADFFHVCCPGDCLFKTITEEKRSRAYALDGWNRDECLYKASK